MAEEIAERLNGDTVPTHQPDDDETTVLPRQIVTTGNPDKAFAEKREELSSPVYITEATTAAEGSKKALPPRPAVVQQVESQTALIKEQGEILSGKWNQVLEDEKECTKTVCEENSFLDLQKAKAKVSNQPEDECGKELVDELDFPETWPELSISSADYANVLGVEVRPEFDVGQPVEDVINDLLSVDEDFRQWYLHSGCLQVPPASEFHKGVIRLSPKEGLEDLVLGIPTLEGGPHGILLAKDLVPIDGKYEEGSQYVALMKLGQGAYGVVYKCCDLTTGKEFVRKRQSKTCFHRNEATVPFKLDQCKNIIQLYGLMQNVVEGQACIEMLLDYAGISLASFVINFKGEVPGHVIWDLTYQALCALECIHRLNIIHFDIKPDNFCIQGTEGGLLLKLIDFGSAKTEQDEMNVRTLTPGYMSPEACTYTCIVLLKLNGHYDLSDVQNLLTVKTDVFSLDLVIHFMFQKKHVLLNLCTSVLHRDMTEEQKKLHSQIMINLARSSDLVKQMRPDRCGLDMRELMDKMEAFRAEDRISAYDARIFMERRQGERTLRAQSFTQKELLLLTSTQGVKNSTNSDCSPSKPYSRSSCAIRNQTKKLLMAKLSSTSSPQMSPKPVIQEEGKYIGSVPLVVKGISFQEENGTDLSISGGHIENAPETPMDIPTGSSLQSSQETKAAFEFSGSPSAESQIPYLVQNNTVAGSLCREPIFAGGKLNNLDTSMDHVVALSQTNSLPSPGCPEVDGGISNIPDFDTLFTAKRPPPKRRIRKKRMKSVNT